MYPRRNVRRYYLGGIFWQNNDIPIHSKQDQNNVLFPPSLLFLFWGLRYYVDIKNPDMRESVRSVCFLLRPYASLCVTELMYKSVHVKSISQIWTSLHTSIWESCRLYLHNLWSRSQWCRSSKACEHYFVTSVSPNDTLAIYVTIFQPQKVENTLKNRTGNIKIFRQWQFHFFYIWGMLDWNYFLSQSRRHQCTWNIPQGILKPMLIFIHRQWIPRILSIKYIVGPLPS